MKTESNFKRWILDEVHEAGYYAKRIEDQYNVGFPDMIVIIPHCPVFFIEVKRVLANMFGPTPRQLVELQRLGISKSTFPMIAGWHPAESKVYLNPPVEQLDRRNAAYEFTLAKGTFARNLKEFYRCQIIAE